MKKLLILAGLAAAFATSAVSAQDTAAQSSSVVRSQIISYSDIDLGTKKGASELKRRVRVAVENVCGTASSSDLTGQNKVNRCYRDNKHRTSAEAAAAISRATPLSGVRIADKK